MQSKNFLWYLSILVFASICFSSETLVLQNGLNGYEGCEDTHLMSVGNGVDYPYSERDKNFHTSITITGANCTS